MTPKAFVAALAEIELSGVFNPYRDHCPIYDLADAPALRRRNLRSYLGAIEAMGADTIWMGRDLGYRGGRRTGLALTDERNLSSLAASYPGSAPAKATKGPVVAERTAAEIWAVLERLERRPLLWNVFPFHPYEEGEPLSNRRFTRAELGQVNELNVLLVEWLGIRRIICIGQDATTYAASFGVEVDSVRHPSYGGVKDFRAGITRIYNDELRPSATPQEELF
ncbi:MAG TPA: uracil-DNA glycosylase [Burkholderiaceae bacterium]|nr:uracil-DNA glycosylase [Burkholderiaceae bacterium]